MARESEGEKVVRSEWVSEGRVRERDGLDWWREPERDESLSLCECVGEERKSGKVWRDRHRQCMEGWLAELREVRDRRIDGGSRMGREGGPERETE